MCDTLINLPHHGQYDLIKTQLTKEKIDRCEPDNGNKNDSITKPDLKVESERLKTYKNWNNENVTPETLAKAGFYSISSNSDLVKCAFCNAEICRWEAGDDPMEEHGRWSPNCPFIREKTRGSLSVVLSPLSGGQDVCGKGEYFPNSCPEDEASKLLFQKIIRSYEDFKSRLETFVDWPKSLKQKPTVLAEAGFYYKGVGDQTVCFQCGGGLKDWEDNDDPWEQHALWFPKCSFLLSSKGQEFIDQVRRKLKPEEEAIPNSSSLSTKETEYKSEPGASAPNDDSTKLCKICFNNGLEVVFIPCGHLLSCVECSLSLKNICPVCRKRFEATMRVFPS